MRAFLRRQGVTLSWRVWLVDGLGFMALGLFASLITGMILKTIGQQVPALGLLETAGGLAMRMLGPAIGVAVALGLRAPPLVVFSAAASGAAGVELGGPVGAYVAAVVHTEVGKLVSRTTPVDILVTPMTATLFGCGVAALCGPGLQAGLEGFGALVVAATDRQPVGMGILVATLMGLALTAPISSAAIAVMIGLEGVAAGAATVGCAAQMVGFAVSGFRENRWGGLVAIGVGTSMLQLPNIVRNPWVLVPPTWAGMVCAPLATTVFQMANNPAGAGMGTSGLVGQIMTVQTMGCTPGVMGAILLLHFALPAVLSLLASEWMRRRGLIRPGDLAIAGSGSGRPSFGL